MILCVTSFGGFGATCSDAEFCALVEHELYHIGHAPDPYGAPAFDKGGPAQTAHRRHGVDEFVGVVARYGLSADVRRLVEASGTVSTVLRLDIARACGCCLKAA